MEMLNKTGTVQAVCRKAEPGLPKYPVEVVEIISNCGVEGDYHAGKYIRHRYLAKKDPAQPNICQVLVVDSTILEHIKTQGIDLEPGMLGENILVDGINMMGLGAGDRLKIGEVILEVTGVRTPCYQLDDLVPGLLKASSIEFEGELRPNTGMMTRVLMGGIVRPGDPVEVSARA